MVGEHRSRLAFGKRVRHFTKTVAAVVAGLARGCRWRQLPLALEACSTRWWSGKAFNCAVVRIEKLQRATVLAGLFRTRTTFSLGRRGRPAGSTVATFSSLRPDRAIDCLLFAGRIQCFKHDFDSLFDLFVLTRCSGLRIVFD